MQQNINQEECGEGGKGIEGREGRKGGTIVYNTLFPIYLPPTLSLSLSLSLPLPPSPLPIQSRACSQSLRLGIVRQSAQLVEA